MGVLFRAAATAAAALTVVTACSTVPRALEAAGPWQAGAAGGDGAPAASTRSPSPAVSVLSSTTPDATTAAFAGRLFSSAPVVVVADDSAGTLSAAENAATEASAPLLLSTATVSASLLTEIKDLRPRDVLVVGLTATGAPATLAARLPGVRVVTSAAQLPETGAPAPLHGLVVLVDRAQEARNTPARHGTSKGSTSKGSTTKSSQSASAMTISAVLTTARVAGATIVTVNGYDPRADPAAIRELAAARPTATVAIGTGFGPGSRLAARLTVAETGRQLPGGGQVLFPGHRLVALYGHPYTPSLGVLGDQDLTESIARARQTAGLYRSMSQVPVVPAFEIIATVAQGSPGYDGTYSYETPVDQLRPWVQAANAAGIYVILDLQPGRANLLTQAKVYQSLLAMPDVGLALDGEWKLQPGQRPLQQIGSISIDEVNSVVRWLSALTARYHLPQKLLVLHQFRISTLPDERQLDTGYDDLAIVIHMDGQGSPGAKVATWGAVTAAAPSKVFFGWKNFYTKDHPMFTPQETMTETPTPVMISYQ